MANEVYTRTNQALSFARLALASWEAAAGDSGMGALTLARYHREHVIFHAYRTVLALIHEVAEGYRWPLLDVRSVEQVLDSDVAERFPGPELGELVQLAAHPQSWLAGLLRAWQQLLAPAAGAASVAGSELIATTAVSAAQWEIDEAQTALDALAAQVERYRQAMQEW